MFVFVRTKVNLLRLLLQVHSFAAFAHGHWLAPPVADDIERLVLVAVVTTKCKANPDAAALTVMNS
jgi:hypothetical protein